MFLKKIKDLYDQLRMLGLYVGFGQFWKLNNNTYNIAISEFPVDEKLMHEITEFCNQNKCKIGIDNVYYDKNTGKIVSNNLFGTKTLFLVIKDMNTYVLAEMIWGDYQKNLIDQLNILKNIS